MVWCSDVLPEYSSDQLRVTVVKAVYVDREREDGAVYLWWFFEGTDGLCRRVFALVSLLEAR